MKVSSPEEIAYRLGYISAEDLLELAKPMEKNSYGKYLQGLVVNTRDLQSRVV
ncbi:MAG: hypothetical protein GX556_18450 [Fibrobacter sp.]|nr:hypothetical protein [Fibrobacter sp.]